MTDKANTKPEETPVHLDEICKSQNFLNVVHSSQVTSKGYRFC